MRSLLIILALVLTAGCASHEPARHFVFAVTHPDGSREVYRDYIPKTELGDETVMEFCRQ